MVHEISAVQLKEMLDAGKASEFFDVRTPGEQELARIEGARLLDQELVDHIATLPRSTPLVFH